MSNMQDTVRFRFGITFSGLARRWRRAIEERLAAAGLADATWAPLIHLGEAGDGLNQTELAARVGIDGSSLVRLLDMLVARGLVERRPDPIDRRSKRLFLTEAGRAAERDLRAILVRAETELLADLDDAEIASALAVFEKIERRLSPAQE
ncbi:MarR family transcriptional regulator [Rhizobium sp. KVB221]|uniref:MarR family transcriptional regulator n=1 Tax=Rhizobium setariae TaxID=2801340 RepID=A0A937CNS5_9HYPH|nr:MarR family transcriptional regulator [Rhizobium setariae]MBL0372324.1 MarR family transcriptional regulator [Rhizobium setariae]